MIGEKIGKIIKVDNTIAFVKLGKFTRMFVEVDLPKSLHIKFLLHGKVWHVQYEGLRLVHLKHGKIGHKEKSCPFHTLENNDAPIEAS